MGRLLLLLFASALLDLWLLAKIAAIWGFWPTLAGVLASSLLGARLAQREGLRVLGQWREALLENRTPEEGVLGGLLVLAGGALLVVPGPLSTLAGLLLLVPAVRRLAGRMVMRAVAESARSGTLHVASFHVESAGSAMRSAELHENGRGNVTVIDTEGEVVPLERRVGRAGG